MADAKDKPKVLLIDDDLTLLTTYEMAFSVKGFETVIAHDGQEGFKKAKEKHPVAIVVDLMMPKLDGKSFLKLIQDDPELAEIPIIVCTALIEDIEKKEIMSMGAKAYYVKTDIDPNELVTHVKDLLK